MGMWECVIEMTCVADVLPIIKLEIPRIAVAALPQASSLMSINYNVLSKSTLSTSDINFIFLMVDAELVRTKAGHCRRYYGAVIPGPRMYVISDALTK
jgi:hypothetical protein